MKRSRLLLLVALALWGCRTAEGSGPVAASPRVLWRIGKPDNNNAEFALAPGGFSRFQDDAFFLVGQSDPKRDWPYVQPGPTDDFTLDSQPLRTMDLTGGVQPVDLFVPTVDRVRKAVVAIATEGRERGRTEVTFTPGVREIVVVFKTHFDIGYTQLAREVVDRYRTSMIDKALEVCDAALGLPPEQRFAWTIPGWPMQQILWPHQTPERRKRIERAIEKGLLVWHALPFTIHTELLGRSIQGTSGQLAT